MFSIIYQLGITIIDLNWDTFSPVSNTQSFSAHQDVYNIEEILPLTLLSDAFVSLLNNTKETCASEWGNFIINLLPTFRRYASQIPLVISLIENTNKACWAFVCEKQNKAFSRYSKKALTFLIHVARHFRRYWKELMGTTSSSPLQMLQGHF